MSIFRTFLDRTYWEIRRRMRVCAECGEHRSEAKGKVNFGFAFDKPKKLYHRECHGLEAARRRARR